MENINESIARAVQSGRPQHVPACQPTARDCMTTSLTTFRPAQTLREVIRILLARGISGGPVVDHDGCLVGMISEMDCLRAVAAGAYDNEPFERSRLVAETMSRDCVTIDPSADIYKMAQLFDQHAVRRLPVLDGATLIGQVSRRDILAMIERRY